MRLLKVSLLPYARVVTHGALHVIPMLLVALPNFASALDPFPATNMPVVGTPPVREGMDDPIKPASRMPSPLVIRAPADPAAIWPALLLAVQERGVVLATASTSIGDHDLLLSINWRGPYGAVLSAADDLLNSTPSMTLSRLEMRRITDTSKVEARVVFKLPFDSKAGIR
jgi:hypothetical protein